MTEHPAAEHSSPATPRTEAGRRLFSLLHNDHAWIIDDADAILAIEREAADAARKEVLDALRQQLPGYTDDLNAEERKGYIFAVDQFRAILDSLARPVEEEK